MRTMQRRGVWLNPPTSALRWHSAWPTWRRASRCWNQNSACLWSRRRPKASATRRTEAIPGRERSEPHSGTGVMRRVARSTRWSSTTAVEPTTTYSRPLRSSATATAANAAARSITGRGVPGSARQPRRGRLRIAPWRRPTSPDGRCSRGGDAGCHRPPFVRLPGSARPIRRDDQQPIAGGFRRGMGRSYSRLRSAITAIGGQHGSGLRCPTVRPWTWNDWVDRAGRSCGG